MSKHFFRALVTDTRNRLHHGKRAPKYGERLYIDVRQVRFYLPSDAVSLQFGVRLRQASGRVVSTWPEAQLRPVEDHPKVQYCLRHWLEGASWEASGAYDYMMGRIRDSARGRFDGCASLDDVRARYAALDKLFTEFQRGIGFKSMSELDAHAYREVGGVVVHIGPGGEPVFGGAGAHRFAMGRALGLVIPVQIGLVHETAVDLLNPYRSGTGRGAQSWA